MEVQLEVNTNRARLRVTALCISLVLLVSALLVLNGGFQSVNSFTITQRSVKLLSSAEIQKIMKEEAEKELNMKADTHPEKKFDAFHFPCAGNKTESEHESGCMKHSSGIKIHLSRDICIGMDFIAIMARDKQHHDELQRCCFAKERIEDVWNTPGCSEEVQAVCRATKGKKGGTHLTVELWDKNDTLKRGLKYVTGDSYWLFTPSLGEHFGHQINRYMQLFNIMHENGMPQFERIVSRQSRPHHEHLRAIAQPIAADLFKKSFFLEDILEQKMRVICMEKAWEPARDQLEYVLQTEEQGQWWREFAAKSYAQYGYNNTAECPPPRAVVLQRTEGTGRRMILNYDVLDRVFARHGMTYTNVSIGGEDGSDRQISLFNNFGLMVSSHSSQLKNLIFAPKNSIVIETRGVPADYMARSPFSMGVAGPLNVHFFVSNEHIPDYSSCPESHGCKTEKMYKTDYWLREDLFEMTLKKALAAQKEKCGDIWAKRA
eukprot:comp48294_c0_seq1/m.47617 comp48294_c0_seq1/g.47617  ORF comp48294_c0_seq1/g.47617 comp48294_c0_seq1/m.47617 type:complete len:489 (-) comp48294_c0_seq1:491-1957(-)